MVACRMIAKNILIMCLVFLVNYVRTRLILHIRVRIRNSAIVNDLSFGYVFFVFGCFVFCVDLVF